MRQQDDRPERSAPGGATAPGEPHPGEERTAPDEPTASDARAALAARLARRPLLFDGAMGTLLFSRGIPQRASLDELVVRRPALVEQIHREYIEAGADAIETCSFGANRLRLASFGLQREAAPLNRRAAQLAREARDVSGRDVLIAGSVGPLESPVRDASGPARALAAEVFREQLEGLLEGGVDLFVLETFGRLEELLAAVAATRELCDLPIVAELTFGDDLVAADGSTPEVAARALAAAGVDVLGVNCGVGPETCLEAVTRMQPWGRARSIMPNAGLPRRIEGRFVYAADPAYLGEAVERFLAAGARILGGCCGTTPAHIAAMRETIDRLAGERTGAADAGGTSSGARDVARRSRVVAAPDWLPGSGVPRTAPQDPPMQTESLPPTTLARSLAAGRFVVSVEIDPPRSVRIERTLQAARLLQEAGADLVNVSDSAMARVRMGAMAVAFAIQRDIGLETLVHLTTRDRNLMALESELLGAHALGVRNILALTGDPARAGDYPSGSGVWDVDSIGLIAILRRLNRGEDQAGSPIGAPAGFTVACALDPTAAELDHELERLESKVAAGADVIMTQPIYATAQWEHLLDRAAAHWGERRLPRPVLLGVLPLHSARHAEFLHNEVPGISIPEPVRSALRAAGQQGAQLGLELAVELVRELRPQVQGVYVMPSFGRYELAAELVRRIRVEGRVPGA